MRFPEYKYKLEENEILHLNFIIHPFVGCGFVTDEGYLGPLGNITNIIYKRIESE